MAQKDTVRYILTQVLGLEDNQAEKLLEASTDTLPQGSSQISLRVLFRFSLLRE